MARSRKPTCVAAAACSAILAGAAALGFIDPDRPASWLVGESKAVAELRIAAVDRNSATFAVVRVMKGEFAPRQITVRWTDVQQPPVDAKRIGAPAVLLVPNDEPTVDGETYGEFMNVAAPVIAVNDRILFMGEYPNREALERAVREALG